MSISKAARILDWKAGKTPGPWRVFVFPTYRCNLKCGYCTKALVKDPPELRKEISDERLLQLIDEGAELDVREWIIGGGGEPMLRGELVMAMCKKIRALEMNGVLQSNGTLFKDEDLETLVRIGWDNVSISIDGPDAETNDTIRWRNSFEKMVHAIKKLNEYKRQYRTDRPTINVACVVTSMNCDRLEDLVRMCDDLEIDGLTLNELYIHHEGMEQYVLSGDQMAALPASARRAEARAEELGVPTNVEHFLENLGTCEKRTLPPVTPERADDIAQLSESMCFDPWLSLSIVSSGNVGPCCVFWEKDSNNIKELSLREAWYGPTMSAMRRDMLGGTPPEPCRTCQADFIRENRNVKGELDAIERDREAWSITPIALIRKGISSVQKNGVSGAFQRGREWLQIRREIRRTLGS